MIAATLGGEPLLTLSNPSHDLADRRGAVASLFSRRLPRMTQSVVFPYTSQLLRIDRKRSGYRAPGAVLGSRLINPRSSTRRCIAGITRVRIGTGGSSSPPRATQSVVFPYTFLRNDRKRSGYGAPGAVLGSRPINTRLNSRRGITGTTRVQIGTGESGSPPSGYSPNPSLKTSTISHIPLSPHPFWLSSSRLWVVTKVVQTSDTGNGARLRRSASKPFLPKKKTRRKQLKYGQS